MSITLCRRSRLKLRQKIGTRKPGIAALSTAERFRHDFTITAQRGRAHIMLSHNFNKIYEGDLNWNGRQIIFRGEGCCFLAAKLPVSCKIQHKKWSVRLSAFHYAAPYASGTDGRKLHLKCSGGIFLPVFWWILSTIWLVLSHANQLADISRLQGQGKASIRRSWEDVQNAIV